MIRLAVEGKLSADRGELDDLARHLDRVGTRTLRTALDLDWTGEQVEMVRQYLEERDIRVGEAAGLYHGLAHPDDELRTAVIDRYKKKIRLVSVIGADFTNFTPGSCNTPDIPNRLHRDDRSEETWERFVRSTCELAVEAETHGVTLAAHPHITGPLYSLERMRRLVDEVGSPKVKILLDPVNMVTIDAYYDMTGFVNESFDVLGDAIQAMHAKDVSIYSARDGGAPWRTSIFHIDEALPGKGFLDYDTILRRFDRLPGDPLLIIEHVRSEDETILAKHYLEYVAGRNGITLG